MSKISVSARMKAYADGQKLLPRTPVVVEAFPDRQASEVQSAFSDSTLMPAILCKVCASLPDAVFGYTDYMSFSILLADFPGWDDFSFRDPQHLSSLVASRASVALPAVHAVFTARSFNLPKDEVINYFIWRQMNLAGNLIRLQGGSLAPESIAAFVESGPSSLNRGQSPGAWWRGRACSPVTQAMDRSVFWDIDTDTPSFSSSRDYITSCIYSR